MTLNALLRRVDGGMQHAEHSDDGENRKSQNDLDDAVARKPTNGVALLSRCDRKLRRQGEAVHGCESQHESENDKLEDQDLPVFGEPTARETSRPKSSY